MAYNWYDYDWPAAARRNIHHRAMMDLRKHIALATVCNNAIPEGTQEGPKDEDHPLRYAVEWKDWMEPYATALTHEWISMNPVTGLGGDWQKVGYVPGCVTVWYEDSFTASITGVSTAVDPKGEFVIAGCTQITESGIFTVNRAGYLTPVSEQWYKEYDDWRPGTPFVLMDCSNPVNNGFYRVRSRRMEGNTLYIAVDNNNYVQQELVEGSCTGTMRCDFGGEWWTFRGNNGHAYDGLVIGGDSDPYFSTLEDYRYVGDSSGRWWTYKDGHHRYPLNGGEPRRGPNDGRPPSGGYMACDFNKDWVRGVNPNLYHSYDRNAHRWFVYGEVDSEAAIGPFYCMSMFVPSHQFLPRQVDPKEQVSPFFFADTNRLHWKYGSKVRIRAAQITNPAKLGAIQACIPNGYMTTHGFAGTSSDRQYGSVYSVTTGSGASYCVNGRYPDPPGTQEIPPNLVNHKYDEALQNMVELACEEHSWTWPVDDDYKVNWLTLNADSCCSLDLEKELIGTQTGTYTYGSAYAAHGLNAYNPWLDNYQPEYALMNDELWGENSSAFELIMKLIGSHDWYYDTQTPYACKRLLDRREEIRNYGSAYWTANDVLGPYDPDTGYEGREHRGVMCYTKNDYLDVYLPLPKETLRRTWPRTLGRVRSWQMRYGGRTDPTCDTYSNYGLDPEGLTPFIMFGHIRMEATTNHDEFFGWSLNISPSSDTFTVSGDVTGNIKAGYKVYAWTGSTYKEYPVLKAVYNSGTGLTTIQIGGDFGTDLPTTIYGDADLSSRHDAEYTVNSTDIYLSRIWKILNDCKTVLAYLKYKDLSISVTMQSYWPWRDIGLGAHDTPSDLASAAESYYQSRYDPDNPANWEPYSYDNSYLSFDNTHGNIGSLQSYDLRYHSGEWKWWYSEVDGNYISEVRAVISSPYIYDCDAVIFLVKIACRKAYKGIDGWGKGPSKTVMGVSGYGSIEPPDYGDAINQPGPFHNMYLPVRMTSNEVKYIRFTTLGNHFTNYYMANEYCARVMTRVSVKLNMRGALDFIAHFDWEKYSDLIWQRLRERADYMLIDPFGPDTKPPVVENDWVVTDDEDGRPMLYDSNFPENWVEGMSWPYDNPGYSPCWKIKAKATLMEDLEGNGVEYIFNCESGEYANRMDATQESRVYDKTLDMGIGTEAGDNEDSWKAYDEGLEGWTLSLNSKDNYSGRVPGSDDNYGTATAPESIFINAPMFPIKPRFKTENGYESFSRIEIGGNFYDWFKCDIPLVPDGEVLSFHIEKKASSALEWTEINISSLSDPVGAPENMTGPGCFWIPAPQYESVQYRFAYLNTTQNKRGIVHTALVAVGYLLEIGVGMGRPVTLNGSPITLPYSEYHAPNSQITLQVSDLYYVWYDYTNGTTTTDNPWTFILDKNMSVEAY
jgi:hypothetical protein